MTFRQPGVSFRGEVPRTMPPPAEVAHVSEFIQLVAEWAEVDSLEATGIVAVLVAGLVAVGEAADIACLFEIIPGTRDLVFAQLLVDATTGDGPPGALPPSSINDQLVAAGLPARLTGDLVALFAAYCGVHGEGGRGECVARIVAPPA